MIISSGTFTYFRTPLITSFTPTSGGAGTLVTITGENFLDASAVSFGGTAATFPPASTTIIRATVASGATGPIIVTTPGGPARSAINFEFFPAPTITSFTPTLGGKDSVVSITGTNLARASAVSIGGTAAQRFTVNSATSISATIASGATGPISVTTPGGPATSSGSFTFVPQPTITGFTPTRGPVGTPVTITGTNLDNLRGVSIGGVPAVPISNSGTQLVAMVMPGAATGVVSLSTAGGSATATGSYSVTASSPPSQQQGDQLVGTGEGRQGWSVSVSADGNTALVGGGGYNHSGAWVFVRSAGLWSQQGTNLVGTGAVGEASQGNSVALSADGNTAIVGGPNDNGGVGAVWFFTRSGDAWSPQGDKLVGIDAVGAARQGCSVALSADGNTALVGGLFDNGSQGAAWVFVRSNGRWSQQGKLVGTGAVGPALQGGSVALSADGNTALVGGTWDNDDMGATWVFARSGGVWSQQGQKLVGTDVSGSRKSIFQGLSVALSANGNTALVGGSGDGFGIGAAWVFTRSGRVWTQQGSKLVGTGPRPSGSQGCSVSLSADGNIALVGAKDPSSDTAFGGAFVFNRSGETWRQHGSLLVGSGSRRQASWQGFSVSLSADGTTAAVGGPGGPSTWGPGAVCIFVPGPR